jgi:hypothetical protein
MTRGQWWRLCGRRPGERGPLPTSRFADNGRLIASVASSDRSSPPPVTAVVPSRGILIRREVSDFPSPIGVGPDDVHLLHFCNDCDIERLPVWGRVGV